MDQVMDALRAERPALPPDRAVPNPALFEAIVARRRRRMAPLAAAACAAVLAGAVVAGQIDVGRSGVRVNGPPAAAADVAHIAAASKDALASTGRALVEYRADRQNVTGAVSFAGDDVEIVLAFGPDGRSPGFEAKNRTVDGQFYLWDAGRWVRDTNAAGATGGDVFNADPRTLVAAVHPEAAFVPVGVEVVDGEAWRHLRATRVDRLPALNLSLGPIDPGTIEQLDVWVGPDDVVRRLDVAVLVVELRPAGGLVKERTADGKVVVRAIEPPPGSTPERVELRSSYSVRFIDVGTPVSITAPQGAVDVAGQG